MLAFGTLAFAAISSVPAPRPTHLALISLAAAVGAALAVSASADRPETLFAPPWLFMILTKTTFGRAWSVHILAAAVFLATVLWRKTGPRLLLAIAAINLVSLAAVGHGSAGTGLGGLLRLVVRGVHLAAAGFWFGALPDLIRVLRKGEESAVKALAAFSRIAVFAALAVGLTGFANAFFETGSARPHLETDYGRLYVAKLALFGALAAVAAVNRFYLAPRKAFRPIARLAGFDLFLFAVILAAAVALASASPTG